VRCGAVRRGAVGGWMSRRSPGDSGPRIDTHEELGCMRRGSGRDAGADDQTTISRGYEAPREIHNFQTILLTRSACERRILLLRVYERYFTSTLSALSSFNARCTGRIRWSGISAPRIATEEQNRFANS
jgi:hypothetical protein